MAIDDFINSNRDTQSQITVNTTTKWRTRALNGGEVVHVDCHMPDAAMHSHSGNCIMGLMQAQTAITRLQRSCVSTSKGRTGRAVWQYLLSWMREGWGRSRCNSWAFPKRTMEALTFYSGYLFIT